MAICSVLDILFIILSKFSKVCLEVSMWNWHFDWHGICYNFFIMLNVVIYFCLKVSFLESV